LARLISLVFIVAFLLFFLLALLLGRLHLSLDAAAQPHALVLALPALGAFLFSSSSRRASRSPAPVPPAR
jgi:hypothetical protein